RAELLDARPARSAGSRHVDGAHSAIAQLANDFGTDSAAGLLHDQPIAEVAGERGDGVELSGEIAIAVRLHQLLRRIEVDADAVRADHFDEPERRVAPALRELLRA